MPRQGVGYLAENLKEERFINRWQSSLHRSHCSVHLYCTSALYCTGVQNRFLLNIQPVRPGRRGGSGWRSTSCSTASVRQRWARSDQRASLFIIQPIRGLYYLTNQEVLLFIIQPFRGLYYLANQWAAMFISVARPALEISPWQRPCRSIRRGSSVSSVG